MQYESIAPTLCVAACFLFVSSVGAQDDDAVKRLGQHDGFSTLKSAIGREPDRSEDGGACGGIVIHDWIKERIRVITLGDSVQVVSDLDAGTDPD